MAIGLQSQLSKEGGTIGYVLIKRAADTSNKFVSKTACTALASLVTYCPGPELLKTLITLSSSKNASQRSESVKSMSQYMENHGFDIMDSREREQIVKVSAKMATDSKPQTRQVGRKLIWYCKNGNLLQQNMIKALPASDQQTISKVLSKGLEESTAQVLLDPLGQLEVHVLDHRLAGRRDRCRSQGIRTDRTKFQQSLNQ